LLTLAGYRRAEINGEGVTGKEADPYPVKIPGIEKPIPSTKVGKYLNDDFWYYYGVYKNCKAFGPPHGGAWIHEPRWVLYLVRFFDDLTGSYGNV
jgi:hypothetical protein